MDIGWMGGWMSSGEDEIQFINPNKRSEEDVRFCQWQLVLVSRAHSRGEDDCGDGHQVPPAAETAITDAQPTLIHLTFPSPSCASPPLPASWTVMKAVLHHRAQIIRTAAIITILARLDQQILFTFEIILSGVGASAATLSSVHRLLHLLSEQMSASAKRRKL